MTKDSLRTAMFLSIHLMLVACLVLFDFWKADIEARTSENIKLAEKLKEAKELIDYLETQTCELDLQVCKIQMFDVSMKVSQVYEIEAALDLCNTSLRKCTYETIEMSSECGI